MDFSRISEDKVAWLEQPFSKEEVMRAMSEFHNNAVLCRSLNPTFIALFPKKPGAVDIKDFRPISLLGNFFKILSKTLAKRMEEVMGTIISVNQNAFVRGRQILDCSLIANECIDAWYKVNYLGVVVQIDMEKAYDHVHWNFVEDILLKMGFGRTWCNWIKVCLSSVTFSVMINGYPEGFFSNSRGIRQGDLLLPVIFNVIMEALCRLVLKAESLSLIQGCRVSPDGPLISLIQYADDTLFCRCNGRSYSKSVRDTPYL